MKLTPAIAAAILAFCAAVASAAPVNITSANESISTRVSPETSVFHIVPFANEEDPKITNIVKAIIAEHKTEMAKLKDEQRTEIQQRLETVLKERLVIPKYISVPFEALKIPPVNDIVRAILKEHKEQIPDEDVDAIVKFLKGQMAEKKVVARDALAPEQMLEAALNLKMFHPAHNATTKADKSQHRFVPKPSNHLPHRPLPKYQYTVDDFQSPEGDIDVERLADSTLAGKAEHDAEIQRLVEGEANKHETRDHTDHQLGQGRLFPTQENIVKYANRLKHDAKARAAFQAAMAQHNIHSRGEGHSIAY